jgi:copper chaperone NosL
MLSIRLNHIYLLLLAFSLSLLSGCTNKDPEPILIGKDSCHYCKMNISDTRFGGEIITPKGKVYKFDSLECLYKFYNSSQNDLGDGTRLFLVNSLKTGHFIPAEEAYIVENPHLRSPMGKGYFVAESSEKLKQVVSDLKADQIMRWSDLAPKLLEGQSEGHTHEK